MASLLEKNANCTVRLDKLKTKWQQMQWFLGYLFDEWLNPCATKSVRGWMNTVFVKIDSLIEGQITKIKTTLEYSRLKEKDNDGSNPIIAPLCYNISHWVLRIIKDEIKKAPKILADPKNLCGHWIYIPLKLEDVHIFWRSLKINGLLRIGGQHSHEESDLQKQLHDFTVYEAMSSCPKYLTSCYPIKSGSCTVLPFYSSTDQVEDTVAIGYLADSERFILHMKNNFTLPPLYEQWSW
ncbi:hypothetical protein M9H77_33947 [Catharanthus roseus]|uniref:Uncharacterized protein n=1 Tax=Catharanthus roseus TaxID=4058 RepID=A0ACB9ZP06_CATRO|nr:hypothetical protein M9H77_33947 [Catharanthus roseus]